MTAMSDQHLNEEIPVTMTRKQWSDLLALAHARRDPDDRREEMIVASLCYALIRAGSDHMERQFVGAMLRGGEGGGKR